jgi:hypothetical protein
MIRCQKCDELCGTEIIYGSDSHGFTDGGPREQWSVEVSDCCATEVYDDGESEPCCPHLRSEHVGDFCPVIGCHCGEVTREERKYGTS